MKLEGKLQARTGNSEARIADFFDFLAGTSTGGILTCIYQCPDSAKRPRFSAQDAVDLYTQNGGEIFNNDLFQRIKSGWGNLDEKYSGSVRGILQEYFGDLRMSELLKSCLIPAYDIDNRSAHFFTQQDYLRKGLGSDFFVRDVCRATSAAPTYFEAALINSCKGVSYPLVDGGVFANNPALCAYSEVRNALVYPTASDMFIVSLGTGSEHTPYKYDEVKNWDAIGWIRPVIDIMMAGSSETTDYHLKKMFSAGGNSNNYTRIQPAKMKNAKLDMDDADPQNLAALVEVGVETAYNCNDELDCIVDILMIEQTRLFSANRLLHPPYNHTLTNEPFSGKAILYVTSNYYHRP